MKLCLWLFTVSGDHDQWAICSANIDTNVTGKLLKLFAIFLTGLLIWTLLVFFWTEGRYLGPPPAYIFPVVGTISEESHDYFASPYWALKKSNHNFFSLLLNGPWKKYRPLLVPNDPDSE